MTSIILEKQSYKELIKVRSSEFNENWAQAMENYKKGNWTVAKTFFDACLLIEKEDGPATTLLHYINEHNCIPPRNWEGVRELVSK